jgi:hypothetical protein
MIRNIVLPASQRQSNPYEKKRRNHSASLPSRRVQRNTRQWGIILCAQALVNFMDVVPGKAFHSMRRNPSVARRAENLNIWVP